MKFSIFCFALLAYVVYASERSEKEPVVKHLGLTADDTGYVSYRPVYQPIYAPVYQPRYLPGYQPSYQSSYQSAQRQGRLTSLLQRTTVYYLMMRLLFPPPPPPTTAAPAPTIAAPAPATVATTKETTAEPVPEDPVWVTVGSCSYLLSTDSVTWVDAEAACEDLGEDVRLVVTGFNQVATERDNVLDAIGGEMVEFWIGARGAAVGFAGGPVPDARWSPPSHLVNPVTVGFTLVQFDTTPATSPVSRNLCGRTDSDDPNRLLFEACDVASYRYVCEDCGI